MFSNINFLYPSNVFKLSLNDVGGLQSDDFLDAVDVFICKKIAEREETRECEHHLSVMLLQSLMLCQIINLD